MSLQIGNVNTLEVLRETEISYILTDGYEEAFLHKRQTTKPLEEKEKVEVFLYFDNQKRITATMNIPFIDTVNPAFLEVVDVNPRLGVFLNMGIQKDLLLSRDDLPFTKSQWPQQKDHILARIKVSKNQLSAKIINRYDMHKYIKPDQDLELNESVDAIILFFADEGIVLSTFEGHLIFVYNKHLRKEYRLGETLSVKIINIKPNYQYNGTLIENKELMIDDDSQIILDYLEKNNGLMNFTDKSDPNLILRTFNMSKSAFKRALGKLYKDKLVKLHKDYTELISKE